MADNCFTDVPFEDITICPNEEVQAGLSPEVYFLPFEFLDTVDLVPDIRSGNLEDAGVISKKIEPVAGSGFIKLDLQVDLNSVSTALIGNRGNKKDQTTLNVFIPGTRAKVLGFKRTYKNVPGIYLVKDYNGKTFVVGTDKAPAYIDNLEVSTGQGAEDNNGGTGTIICNDNLFEYSGEIARKIKGISVKPASLTINIKEPKGHFYAEVFPPDASQDVYWKYDDPDRYVNIDPNGEVTIMDGMPESTFSIIVQSAVDTTIFESVELKVVK